MRPEEKDLARLWDMLDAARCVLQFSNGRSFEDFLNDRMFRCAVERCLEIIGEAARHVSIETRAQNPYIPWVSIIGLRNVIAHEYGEVLNEKLWAICVNRLPALVEQLEKIVPDSLPTDDGSSGS